MHHQPTVIALGILGLTTILRASDPIAMTVDGSQTTRISPYIYGFNTPDWARVKNVTLARWGGNRITAYNWVNNASNAGADWQNQNDALMDASDAPANPIKKLIEACHAHDASTVVTIPTLGYVAADKNGGGDVNQTPDYLKTRFDVSLPTKPAPFAAQPTLQDGKVYQDECVGYLEKAFPESRTNPVRTVFYALDNEPDLWQSAHSRIHPDKVTYEEVIQKNIVYGRAVKAVAPKALVFGFVSYGWNGYTTLQGAPDAAGRDFIETYLDQMAKADKDAGHRLVDVLDLHWYPEAQGGGVRITEDDPAPAVAAAREQAPRSLWDRTYTEESWITQSQNTGPLRLLPRIADKIAKHDPGVKLSLTEYYYGGGAHISGAIAEADALGIFGREGLFAAAIWTLGKTDQRFTYAGFSMFRDFDGKGACFGDTSIAAQTADSAKTSIYASTNGTGNTILVVINKSLDATPIHLTLKNVKAGPTATIFELTAADAHPKPIGSRPIEDAQLDAQLPAQSIWTIVLSPRSFNQSETRP